MTRELSSHQSLADDSDQKRFPTPGDVGVWPAVVMLERDGDGRFFDHDVLYASYGELFSVTTTINNEVLNTPPDSTARVQRPDGDRYELAGLPPGERSALELDCLRLVPLPDEAKDSTSPWRSLSRKGFHLEPQEGAGQTNPKED